MHMKFEYTQMREDTNEYPLETFIKLSKSQQRLFSFLLQRRNNINQQRISGVEIAECLEVYAQQVSTDIKAIADLDMIRRDKHYIIMINPHMWFFGDKGGRLHVISLWDALPKISKNIIEGGLRTYHIPQPQNRLFHLPTRQ